MIEADGYVARPYKLSGELTGRWGLTIELRRCTGYALNVQHVTPDRTFNTEEDAHEYAADFYAQYFG